MTQTSSINVRKTVEMDTELANTIKGMADERIWSFSQMAYVLLQQAVKEKTRKRKAAKEDNS